MQAVAERQATPVTKPSWPSLGVVMASSDHVLPFHRSATVPKPGAVVDPTAVHAVTAEHETAESSVNGAFGTAGVGTMVQFMPFQRSASATVDPDASLVVPTATQLLALTQE